MSVRRHLSIHLFHTCLFLYMCVFLFLWQTTFFITLKEILPQYLTLKSHLFFILNLCLSLILNFFDCSLILTPVSDSSCPAGKPPVTAPVVRLEPLSPDKDTGSLTVPIQTSAVSEAPFAWPHQ